ncbi:HDOD domain-containing protein [Candidatus Latescibacterota bacterium]
MMKRVIDRETIKSAIASNMSFTNVPSVAVPIIKMFNNPNTSFQDLSKVIETDPELSARVLRISNSGYYGFREKIKTVSHAVTLLGWNTIKMISLGSTILTMMKKKNKRLHEHSNRAANIARFLALESHFYKIEEITVVGLLHDIGSIILETCFPDEYYKAKQYAVDHKVPFHIAEKKILGFDHGVIGGWTLEDWDMPKNIATSVMWHHNYKDKKYHSRKTAVIHVADVLSIALDFNGPGWEKVPEVSQAAIDTLGYSETKFRDIIYTLMDMKFDPLIT